jgi:glutamate N-acetyltransferase/amino-acid N-acetyltransferase
MIHPQMATTLTFLTTDAAVTPSVLQAALRRAADQSFNRITVDGDRSTNDTILLLANGEAGASEIGGPGEALEAFQAALDAVTLWLAKDVARDGEGATKLIDVTIRGAESDDDAHRAAKAVANSPLVKTALYGRSPNWGRILAAVGYSGAEVQADRLAVRIGPALVAERGAPVAESRSAEEAARHLAGDDIQVTVDLGLGRSECTVWTCDLTEAYIKENAGLIS